VGAGNVEKTHQDRQSDPPPAVFRQTDFAQRGQRRLTDLEKQTQIGFLGRQMPLAFFAQRSHQQVDADKKVERTNPRGGIEPGPTAAFRQTDFAQRSQRRLTGDGFGKMNSNWVPVTQDAVRWLFCATKPRRADDRVSIVKDLSLVLADQVSGGRARSGERKTPTSPPPKLT